LSIARTHSFVPVICFQKLPVAKQGSDRTISHDTNSRPSRATNPYNVDRFMGSVWHVAQAFAERVGKAAKASRGSRPR
jgi:hypothetical protein